MNENKVNLFIFWEYESFPYILGGIATNICEDGKFEVEGYPGFRFKAIACYPIAMGITIKQKLAILTKDYAKKRQHLEEEFKNKVKEIFK